MSNLITTNIRIPREDYALYKMIAAQKGESFAEFVRKTLAEKVKQKTKNEKKKKYSLWDLGTKYVIKGGDRRASQTIDEVVYGHPHGFPEKEDER